MKNQGLERDKKAKNATVVAALDIGTNTALCLIAEIQAGQILRVLSDRAKVIRLGQGMDQNKEFHADALERLDQCLESFKREIEKYSVDRVVAVATSAARDAKNRDLFFEIAEKHGIPTQVIAGQVEAELTFLGGTVGIDETEGLAIVDVGGGSTELIFKDKSGAVRGESLDIGAVRLTERLVSGHPIPDQDIESIQMVIQKHMDEYETKTLNNYRVKRLVAVAGTPTTLATLIMESEFDEMKVHGFALSRENLDHWVRSLADKNLEERRRMPGMQINREDVIVAGAMILRASLGLFQLNEMTVSTKGVRYGLALKAAADEI